MEGTVDALAAETGCSGVVRLDRDGRTVLAKAYGFAHRGLRVPNTSAPGSRWPGAPRG